MKHRTLKIALLSLLLLFVLTVGGGYFLFLHPHFERQDSPSTIYIYPEDNYDTVSQKLKEFYPNSSFMGFKLLAKYGKYPKNIKTGMYVLENSLTPIQLYRLLSRGYQTPVKLIVSSERLLGKTIKSMGNQLMIDSMQIDSILRDSISLEKIGFTEETLPAFFIPNTYEVYWNISPKELLERLHREYQKFWNKKRIEQASKIGFSPIEIAVLASIVDEETNKNDEKPTIAGLYINRIQRGIPLQADPTIKFALQNFEIRRITNRDLEIESPYNTYLNLGLPPGPIRIPSIKGIDSILYHENHNYIYMCAKDDLSGYHNFASTYSQHMQNARKYWSALNRQKIFR